MNLKEYKQNATHFFIDEYKQLYHYTIIILKENVYYINKSILTNKDKTHVRSEGSKFNPCTH